MLPRAHATTLQLRTSTGGPVGERSGATPPSTHLEAPVRRKRSYSLTRAKDGTSAPEAAGLACHSAKVGNSDHGKPLPRHLDPAQYPPNCLIQVTRFKNGDLLRWPTMNEPPPSPDIIERASREQSVRSRLRSAFALGNAETSWLAMATLTYRVNPADYASVRDDWTRFKDRLRKKWKSPEWGWILEFQRRGAAHFHVFLGSGGELGKGLNSEATVTRKRKGQETEILAGPIANWISETWIDIVGDNDPKFLKFQRGGIVEKMRSPDAAGRYAAKEAAKRVQKVAPWEVSQWWGMSNSIRPDERSFFTMTVEDFQRQFPGLPVCSRLWSHAKKPN